MSTAVEAPLVRIGAAGVVLEGELELPEHPSGIVVFSHGSGSGRRSPRNQYVASRLRAAGVGTLLIDLLTPAEDRRYETRFDIHLLTERLGHAVSFAGRHAASKGLPRWSRAAAARILPARACSRP